MHSQSNQVAVIYADQFRYTSKDCCFLGRKLSFSEEGQSVPLGGKAASTLNFRHAHFTENEGRALPGRRKWVNKESLARADSGKTKALVRMVMQRHRE